MMFYGISKKNYLEKRKPCLKVNMDFKFFLWQIHKGLGKQTGVCNLVIFYQVPPNPLSENFKLKACTVVL